MSKVVVWHNPSCGSSTAAVKYIRDKGFEPELYLYLRERPDAQKIREVLKSLRMQPSELLRPKEEKGQELGLYGGQAGEEDILAAMASHPVLIQRPIVITPTGSVIARPKGRIDDIL